MSGARNRHGGVVARFAQPGLVFLAADEARERHADARRVRQRRRPVEVDGRVSVGRRRVRRARRRRRRHRRAHCRPVRRFGERGDRSLRRVGLQSRRRHGSGGRRIGGLVQVKQHVIHLFRWRHCHQILHQRPRFGLSHNTLIKQCLLWLATGIPRAFRGRR